MTSTKISMEMAKEFLKEMESEGFTLYKSTSVGKSIEESIVERRYGCSNPILNSLAILLPQMTESEKNDLLAFGEGMTNMYGHLRSTMNPI